MKPSSGVNPPFIISSMSQSCRCESVNEGMSSDALFSISASASPTRSGINAVRVVSACMVTRAFPGSGGAGTQLTGLPFAWGQSSHGEDGKRRREAGASRNVPCCRPSRDETVRMELAMANERHFVGSERRGSEAYRPKRTGRNSCAAARERPGWTAKANRFAGVPVRMATGCGGSRVPYPFYTLSAAPACGGRGFETA